MEADTQRPAGPTYVLEGGGRPSKWESTPWGWWWEILMTTVSLGCMVAIVAILATMRDRPLADWTFFLSISATLAIFATAAKAASASAVGACISQSKWLHFRKTPRKLGDLDLIEEASRGPLGSLVLVVKRPVALVSIGAVVVLLTLAFDVFVQQVVDLQPVDIATADLAAVLNLAHDYNGGTEPVWGDGNILKVREATADQLMQGAVYRGLFNLGSTPVFNCSSDCRWHGTHVSLGYASSCADVTAATLELHGNASATWNGTQPGSRENMNLTTPGGITLDAVYGPTHYVTAITVGAVSRLNVSQYGRPDDDVYMYPDIARIAVLQTNNINAGQWYIRDPASEFTVVECDIDLVAYRYADVSSSGRDLIVGKQELVRLGKGIATHERGHAVELWFNETGLPPLRIGAPDVVAVAQLFTSLRFTGTIKDGLSAPDTPRGMGDAFIGRDIAQAVQAMVDSMTDQLRSSNRSVAVRGESIHPVVFVRVRWGYLTLPIFVLLAAAVFVVLVLAQSYRTPGLPLWRSSTTALLTYDVRFRDGDDDGVGRLGTGIRTMEELDNYADGITAKLELPEQHVTQAGAGNGYGGHPQDVKRA